MDKSQEGRILESLDSLSSTTTELVVAVKSDSLGRAIKFLLVISVIHLIALIVVTSLLVTGASERKKTSATIQNTNMITRQIKAVLDTLESATTPTGCIAVRNEALRAEAVRHIENVNRVIHRMPPVEATTEVLNRINTPCPGETKP